MAKIVVVRQGESVAKLAEEHGHFHRTIWDDPANAALRAKREHMNVLFPGDEVGIPDRREKTVPAATGRRHVFRRRGVPALFRVQIFRNRKPLAHVRFTLTIDGVAHQGETDGAGKIEVHIPTGAVAGTLVLGEDGDEIAVRFGHLDPSTEIEGVQKRLHNLGLYDGALDGKPSRATTDAILDFQLRYDLPPTGEPDEATRRKLRAVHDTINEDVGEELP